MKVANVQNIVPANTVLNTNINSDPMPLYHVYGYSIQAVYTGTPTGTFKLQASSDPVFPGNKAPNSNFVVNWTDVANSSVTVTAAGNYMWNVTDVMYNFVRLVYTDGSSGASTAVLTVSTFNAKGI